MIGGADIVLYGVRTCGEVEVVLKRAGADWPDGVFHDLDSPEPARLADALRSVSRDRECELFIYKDRRSFDSWESEGATESNADSMIHVLIRSKSMTFVVHAVDSETGKLGIELKRAIEIHRGPKKARERLRAHNVPRAA